MSLRGRKRVGQPAVRNLLMLVLTVGLFISASGKDGQTNVFNGGREWRWETDQPGFKPNLTYPILYRLVLDGLSMAAIHSFDAESDGPSFGRFEEAFTKGPRMDKDGWLWNFGSHPFNGSETYLRARAQGCPPGSSFLFTAVASTVWEFGIESWWERPSTQDLISTPVAGALIGEARFRAKRALLEADTGLSRTLAIVIDPIQKGAEVIGGAFGKDWTEPAFRKAPMTTSQSGPMFMMGLASYRGQPALSIQCHIPL